MLELYEQIFKLSQIPSSIDILSTAPVPGSASAGVELGTAQPQLVCLWGLMKCKNMKSFRTGIDIKENKMLRIRDYLALFVKNTERRRKIRLIFDIYSHCGGKY